MDKAQKKQLSALLKRETVWHKRMLKQERQRIADLAIAEANKTRQTPGMDQAWAALMAFSKLIREME